MAHFKVAGVVAACIATSGCATTSFQELQPIDEKRILAVVGEIKRQIGVYMRYQQSANGYARMERLSRQKICGNGLVGFDIKSVRMELLSTTDTTVAGSIAGGYPPFSGSLGFGHSTANSQTLIVDYDVLPSRLPAASGEEDDFAKAPIAGLMKNLSDAAEKAGDQRTHACVRMKQTPQAGTYKIGITVTDTGNGNVAVGLSNVALGAGGDFKSTTGNTITVTFAPHKFSGGNSDDNQWFYVR